MNFARMLLVCSVVALASGSDGAKMGVWRRAGGGFYTSENVTSAGSSASAKIQNNIAGGAWLGNNGNGHWGGELRFDDQLGDLALSQGGTQASLRRAYPTACITTFSGMRRSTASRIRPFVSLGAGVKIYQGTGAQVAYQPLSNFALLTPGADPDAFDQRRRRHQVPDFSSRSSFRAEVHDYATPFLKQVITPAQNAKVGGWLQDFVPMVGISYTSPEGR